MSAVHTDNDRFRHEALLYSGWPEFVAGCVPFIKGGLEAGEPVLVVESRQKIDTLRMALDGDADRVLFADMAEVGANPARIIPAWEAFVARHGATGKRLRGIGEPIWSERPADELVECQRHEALLNVAFGRRRPWWLLCPYDAGRLDDAVIEEALRSHEYVMQGGASRLSSKYPGIDVLGSPFATSLPEPSPERQQSRFDAETLFRVRRDVSRFALANGMQSDRVKLFVTAVNEAASNSIVHGGGAGTLTMWRDGIKLVAEVRDSGRYAHPLADRLEPGSDASESRGLWLANQLCDLVQIRTYCDGTVFRLHMKVDANPRLRVLEPEEPQAPAAN